MSPLELLLFLAGLAALIVGAEMLVKGASRLASALGIPTLVIGLTVVAFGTSAPELAVSLRAAGSDQAALAVGNVVGSNLFNVLFILGLSALVTPLAVHRKLVRLDVPVMIGISLVTWAMAADGAISRVDGLLLFSGCLVYTGFLFWEGRREGLTVESSQEGNGNGRRGLVLAAVLAVAGLALLVLGSRWLVDGAVVLARSLGVGERIIGLTLVAAGTSLPEVATSVIAALRGQRDIAVGNVVGSNAFNLLAVAGASAAVSPAGLAVTDGILSLDLPVMVAVAVACLPIFFTGFEIDRREGALFLLSWCGYTFVLYKGVEVAAAPLALGFLALVGLLTAAQLWRRRPA